MSISIVNIGRIDGDTIIVEFSDESFVTFTVAELMSAKRSRKETDTTVVQDLMN